MDMDRTLWTDERIDDAIERIEKRFDAVDRRFEQLERRMERLEDQMIALRREMHQFMLATVAGYVSLAGLIVAHW